jgi:hypothetical protein
VVLVNGAVAGEIASTAWSVTIAVVPLTLLFLAFQFFFLRMPRKHVADVLKGTAIAAVGLFLFLLGISIAFLPFGRAMGELLGGMTPTWPLVLIGMALGWCTAWGEPSVRILADQAEEASNGSIRKSMVLYAICIGVALCVAVGILRIVYEIPLLHVLVPGYAVVIGLMWVIDDKSFLAIAVDAGGVATGPLANSFLLAFALGVSASRGDQDAIVHGFGLVALIALAPIISVMTLGLLVRLKSGKE